MTDLLSKYMLEDGTDLTQLTEGVQQLIMASCELVKAYGDRAWVTNKEPETKIQVLDTYINIYVHTEKLAEEITITEDGLTVCLFPICILFYVNSVCHPLLLELPFVISYFNFISNNRFLGIIQTCTIVLQTITVYA